MDYLFEHPSSLKCEGIAPLTGNPIRVAQQHPPTGAATESEPKTFLSDFAQATQDLLMEDSPANRASAARRLGKSGKRSATSYLIAALSDSSLEVRMAAAESLGQLGELAEMAHLRDLLARGTQNEMEERVISEAIRSIGAREAKVDETPPNTDNETQPINRVLNPVHLVVDTNAQPNEIADSMTETEFPSLTNDERLCDEEVALRQARQDFEQRRAESEKLRRAHNEEERVAALEANRRVAEREAEQRNEAEQKLCAEIEELRKAESEQLERIEVANTAAPGRWSEPAENEVREVAARRDGAEAETQLAQVQAIRFDAESEVEVQAAEKRRLDAEIKTLSKAATEQIDRMEQASARLTVLEQLRLHAETMVYQRAEREIRLEAEIAALRKAEAAQIKRIEQAEAEARQLAEERQQAAVEARKQVEEVTRRLAEEEEQRIEHLETIRCKAEAAAQQRAEKERLLTSQLLAFGNAAAEQVQRIERAEANLREAEEKTLQFEEETRQKSEQEAIRLAETLARRQAAEERLRSAEAQARQQAQEEERTIAQLEIIRAKAEKEAQQRREQIQRLNADIEALRKIEVEQSQRIEETQTRLHQMEAETRQRAQDEEQRLADLESLRSQAKTMGQHRRDPNGEPNVNSKAEVEIARNETSEPISPGHSEKAIDRVRSKENVRVTSDETSGVPPLAECISAGDPAERAGTSHEVAQLSENDAFGVITSLFDDGSAEVRNGAARALYNLAPNRADTFTRALREAPPDRRRRIIRALDGSGLAAEAIDNLVGDDQEKTNDAFSLLFLMARAGEFELLLQTIEKHPSSPVRLSVIKLLTICNKPEIIPAFRSLAVRGSLPTEVRSALVASIYEISNNARENSRSAA